ncbi:hypothetical protein, partial [Streptomyces sp. NPDC048527]|uniref:hypothetical protein n=1 Tax=Streptomyces sp. NPDC048527 TaxID=3365568 RepID=UPI00371B6725
MGTCRGLAPCPLGPVRRRQIPEQRPVLAQAHRRAGAQTKHPAGNGVHPGDTVHLCERITPDQPAQHLRTANQLPVQPLRVDLRPEYRLDQPHPPHRDSRVRLRGTEQGRRHLVPAGLLRLHLEPTQTQP